MDIMDLQTVMGTSNRGPLTSLSSNNYATSWLSFYQPRSGRSWVSVGSCCCSCCWDFCSFGLGNIILFIQKIQMINSFRIFNNLAFQKNSYFQKNSKFKKNSNLKKNSNFPEKKNKFSWKIHTFMKNSNLPYDLHFQKHSNFQKNQKIKKIGTI